VIADVILSHDRRGISRLRPRLPADYVERAASCLVGASVLIVTGFIVAGRGETDGPPGAIALARAVGGSGGRASIVSDGHTAFALMRMELDVEVLAFPMLDAADSLAEAARVLDRLQPSVVLAIERCGPGSDGCYRNMRGEDISAVTGCLDALVAAHRGVTVGIGDGGNEVGMGSLASACVEERVTPNPCVVAVDHPVIASVSNWGAWGLIAAMSPTLLPTDAAFTQDLEALVCLGCVDGISRRSEPTVDGFTLEENLDVLRRLRLTSPGREAGRS